MIKKPATSHHKNQLKAKPAAQAHVDVAKPMAAHLNELRLRIMWIVLTLGIASIAGYFIHEQLLAIVRKPLGQTLYYTSPVGGLNFLMKLCLTFGVIVALPVIMYQLLKFFAPLLERKHKRAIAWYVTCSIILAYGGVTFAYFVSLPSALHFLANFGGKDVTSLITADEYYSFAFSYLTGFALLFQLPIIILFINRINPLKPGGMMKYQRWIVLASFVVAAILTPTPDPINQAIMAAPAIVLYQISLILVWRVNRKRHIVYDEKDIIDVAVPQEVVSQVVEPALQPVAQVTVPKPQPRMISDFGVQPERSSLLEKNVEGQRTLPAQPRQVERRAVLPPRPAVHRMPRQMRAMDIFAA